MKIRNVILLFCLLLFACKNNEKSNETVLDIGYMGKLTLYFFNTSYPEFQSEENVDVEITKDGEVTISTGVLTYSGEEINSDGDGKIKREGTINIAPSGTVYKNENGDAHISIDENSTINENTIMWVKNNENQWIEVSNTNMSETWNGGLDFDIDLATINGAVIDADTENGSVKWSLYLLPRLTK